MASFYQFELRGYRIAEDFLRAERPVELWFMLELGFKSGGHALSGLNFWHPDPSAWIALLRDLTPDEISRMGQLVSDTQPFSVPQATLSFEGRRSALQLRVRKDIGSQSAFDFVMFEKLDGIAPGSQPLRQLVVSMVALLENDLPHTIFEDILAVASAHP
jgi:hypothetical protein